MRIHLLNSMKQRGRTELKMAWSLSPMTCFLQKVSLMPPQIVPPTRDVLSETTALALSYLLRHWEITAETEEEDTGKRYMFTSCYIGSGLIDNFQVRKSAAIRNQESNICSVLWNNVLWAWHGHCPFKPLKAVITSSTGSGQHIHVPF